MGDRFITKMIHFEWKNEDIWKVPKEALNNAEYLGQIIENTVGKTPDSNINTGIQCRRRPNRRRCISAIQSRLHPSGNELEWWCPVCGDSGNISEWVGTRWEPKEKPYTYIDYGKLTEVVDEARQKDIQAEITLGNSSFVKSIRGNIETDKKLGNKRLEIRNLDNGESKLIDANLPRIVTKNGHEYGWIELGLKLMTYEGCDILIKISE